MLQKTCPSSFGVETPMEQDAPVGLGGAAVPRTTLAVTSMAPNGAAAEESSSSPHKWAALPSSSSPRLGASGFSHWRLLVGRCGVTSHGGDPGPTSSYRSGACEEGKPSVMGVLSAPGAPYGQSLCGLCCFRLSSESRLAKTTNLVTSQTVVLSQPCCLL